MDRTTNNVVASQHIYDAQESEAVAEAV